jgi:hypothetical protein
MVGIVLGILLTFFVNAIIIGYSAYLFRATHQLCQWRWLLLCSYCFWQILTIIIAPIVLLIVGEDGGYGDVYFPYMIMPGTHIYFPAAWVGRLVFPQLLSMFSQFTASVISVVILPGMVSLLVGSLQWYLIGRVLDWNETEKSAMLPLRQPENYER